MCLILVGCGGGSLDQLVGNLSSDKVEVRREAMRKLKTMRPTQERARQAIADAVHDADREVRRLACATLGEMDQTDPQILKGVLRDPEDSVRIAGAYALLKIEPNSSAATDVLKQVMRNGDGGVIVTVTRQGSDAAWAVPTLIDLLQDRRAGIRRLAAEGLGRIGKPAESALPALRTARNDEDDRVRDAATEATNLITRK
jgi:HEAT repeat protein